MKNTTYRNNADSTHNIYCFEGGGAVIASYFPEHVKEQLIDHFKRGIVPLEFANIREKIKIEYDLYNHELNFTAQLIEALYTFGFIEGQRYAKDQLKTV